MEKEEDVKEEEESPYENPFFFFFSLPKTLDETLGISHQEEMPLLKFLTHTRKPMPLVFFFMPQSQI